MEATDYIDADEGREFPGSKACYNCGAQSKYGAWLTEVSLEDGCEVLACDDCIAEAARLETLADELAAKPSCEIRQRIIDTAQTTAELVNRLAAHDMERCVPCEQAAERAGEPDVFGPCDVCDQLDVLVEYDAKYDLRYCASCAAEFARMDSIVGRHNAEIAAARRVA